MAIYVKNKTKQKNSQPNNYHPRVGFAIAGKLSNPETEKKNVMYIAVFGGGKMWLRLRQDFQEMHSLCAEPFPSAL